MALASGTKLGPYEIQSSLGAGGMGEVYRARDTRLDRTVAIKILPAHLSSDLDARQRFQREARTISSLNHPHICQLYDIGAQDGANFLVMEFLEGETLSARLQKGPLQPEQCLKIAIELCEGLEKAHRSGVIHRDLKPANIFLTSDGHAKLLDFGLAKTTAQPGGSDPEETRAAGEDVNLTSPGSAVGTVAYMSPEQARGEALTEHSDLFSLGIVIYEMASGQRPFVGSTTAMIFDSILNRQPVPLSQVRPALSLSFGELVARLMAKSLRERCQSAREVIETLQEIQREGQSSSSAKVRAGRKIPSIAVLPFANLSTDPDNQYFSDGLSEDLISALARLQGLLVASRGSSFRFRGDSADIREIGRQLNVQAILEGSVRRAGKRLRITAQLVDVADGYQLWSERYDREITDIFEIQDEIAAAIVKTLEPTLAGQQQALTRRHSENLQAYELYLKGRRLWDQRLESALRAGLECFRAAIELDPDYALAHTGIADSFSILAVYGYTSILEGRPRVEAAMKKALELDPTLAESHFSMALSTTIVAAQPGDAERHFRKALEIQPRSSAIHAYFSLYLATQHRFDEVPVHIAKAIELDPLSPFVYGLTGLSLQCSSRYEEAIRNARHSLELQPNMVLGLWALQMATCSLARWDEAIEAGEQLVSVTRHSALFLGNLAKAYALSGQREKSLAILREVLQRQQSGEYISPMCLILIHTALQDLDSAHAALVAYIEDGGNGWGLEIAVGPYVDTLAVDKRCAELLRRLGRLEVV
jgi:serine/threonine protein kinase/tetratricopeptide (TPR) repeat protein